jgi:hypothetical protein
MISRLSKAYARLSALRRPWTCIATNVLVFGGAALLSAVRMRTSLWLDETISYWTVKDLGLFGAIQKTVDNPPQSPLYAPIVWAAVAIGGASETVLRLPSFAATAVAVYVIYRLGGRFVDRETGLMAALIFAYWYAPALAGNARQYGIAMLSVVASTLFFVRWLEQRRLQDAAAYVVCASAFLYFQVLYAPLLVIHLLLAWERGRWETRRLAVLIGAIGVLCVPLLWHFSSLRTRAVLLTFSSVLSWSDAAPFLVACGLLAGALLAVRRRLPSTNPTITLAAWTIVPFAALVALGQVTGLGIAIWRYAAYMAPGVVLALAATLRGLSPFKRYSLLGSILVVATMSANTQSIENWREGAARVRSLGLSDDTPVLVRTGIPEAREWYRIPERSAYLLTPMAFYAVPGRLIPLPYKLDAPAIAYLESDVVPKLRNSKRVVVFAHDYEFSERVRLPFQAWFDRQLPEFVSRQIWRDRDLMLLVYER